MINRHSIRKTLDLLICLLAVGQPSAAKSSDIHQLVESTKLAHYSDITFFLRLPKQPSEPAKHVRSLGREGAAVRGVLALCTHRAEPEDVRINVTDDGRFKWFVRFADRHNLALVTWTNFKGYPTYIGDYLNSEAFKREVASKYMAPEVMVALPTKEIAEAWGTVLNIVPSDTTRPGAQRTGSHRTSNVEHRTLNIER